MGHKTLKLLFALHADMALALYVSIGAGRQKRHFSEIEDEQTNQHIWMNRLG